MAAEAAAIRYPRRQGIRTLLKLGIRAAFGLLADVQVEGRENLPKTGPALLVGNHFSFLDPVIFIGVLPYPLEFIGGVQAPNAPRWTDIFRRLYGVVAIRRGSSSRDGLNLAQEILNQKGILAIFPEGGSWADVRRPPRPGAALLAARSGAPIVPIGLDGFTRIFPNLGKKRTRATVRIGKPFGPFKMDVRDRSSRQQMDVLGHQMMRRIAELIPPERRGFYSDDPAIREAARGTEVYPWEGIQEA